MERMILRDRCCESSIDISYLEKLHDKYENVYKSFDINLFIGTYNYEFDWNEGDIFIPNLINANNYFETLGRIPDITPTGNQLSIYPNPFN